jgi:hypothetical protein
MFTERQHAIIKIFALYVLVLMVVQSEWANAISIYIAGAVIPLALGHKFAVFSTVLWPIGYIMEVYDHFMGGEAK